MLYRSSIGVIAVVATLSMKVAFAQAPHESKYPDLNGEWSRGEEGAQWDPSKPRGLQQQAPLTAEYLAIFEANLAALHSGSGGGDPQLYCLPSGMPRVMIAYEPFEVIVTPEITYVRVDHLGEFRRIYTDGRDWPADIEPSFQGYSIGRWVDSEHKGRFDTLEVETRVFKGPRAIDPTGIPVHADNQSIVRERIHLVKDILHDELTLIDHALTRPWSVDKIYERTPDKYPWWREENCPGTTRLVKIHGELYFKGADDKLMPTRKDQPPPDLRYFQQARH
jgi:hypothetical protein